MAEPGEQEGHEELGVAATMIVGGRGGAEATAPLRLRAGSSGAGPAGLGETMAAPTLDEFAGRSTRAPSPGVQRGSSIGRYLVLDRLGAGGMGEVFAAYDPELDRKVAIKLLRAGLGDDASTAGRSRLVREAQAMARLSHPNVVAVHDVGTVDEQVFIAMEFVEGETLGAWLSRARPPWPRIVEVFLAAGRGLEAAHAVGLVHRDFKPDNVLIGRDGRVRVGDFGLARAQAGEGVRELAAAALSVANAVTMTGGILGTPAYMSPEQFAGGDVDVRSDIFSFCAALYEALYGRRPFTGETLAELMAAVLSEHPAPPPRGPAPKVYGAICLRGLAREPARRYPSMQALLAELAVDPRRRRRRLLGAIVGCAVAAAGAGGVVARQHALEARCAAVEEALVGVWDAPRKAEIRARFAGLDRPYLADASARVEELGDRYAASWAAAAGAACRAHAITGERDDAEYMLERTCLDHQLDRFAELARLLAAADVEAAARAIDALLALRPPEQCGDIEAIRPVYASLDDPTKAAAIAAVRRELDQAATLSLTGRFEPALERAASAAERAAATGFSPLVADAEVLRGELATTLHRPEAQDALHRGLKAAIASNNARVAASAALGLAAHLTEIDQRYDDARRWIELAGAWLGERGDPGMRVTLLIKEARIARWQNRQAEALEILARAASVAAPLGEASPQAIAVLSEQAQLGAESFEHEGTRARGEALVERLTAIYGPEHPSIGDALSYLALAAQQRDAFDEAEALNRRAMALRQRSLGERHQLVGENLITQGLIETARGRFEAALAVNEQARAIFVESLGERHSLVARADNNIGNSLRSLHRLDASAAVYARSLALRREQGERNLYPPTINLAMVHYERGWEHVCDGDKEAAGAAFQESIRLGREALQMAARTVELDHPHVGIIHTSLGLALSSAGDHEEALIEHQAALAILEKRFGATSTQLAFPLLGIGRELRHLGRPREALAPLERARALPALPGDTTFPHELGFELAQALWDADVDRPRALELARGARDFYGARERETGGDCGAATRWLATHRLGGGPSRR